MRTRFIIERKGTGINWEAYAYPINDLTKAKQTIDLMRIDEQEKKYKSIFRLVRETREIIENV